MNSFRQNRNPGRSKLVAATLLVIFLFGADVFSGGKIRYAVRPVGMVVYSIGSTIARGIQNTGLFATRASLETQIRTLQDQLTHAQDRAAGYDALKRETDDLQALAHLAETAPGITAPIVSSMSASPYGTFLIGAGSAEGVSRGSLVVTPAGFAVGEIDDVGPHTAVVKEIFAAGASLEATINNTPVSLQGSGGGNAHAEVPRGVVITNGDTVFAPTHLGRPVGIVGEVASSSAGAAQDIYVRLPISIASLHYVYVIAH